jgi:hypothetical protein
MIHIYYTYLVWDCEIGAYRQGPYFKDKVAAEESTAECFINWGTRPVVYEVPFRLAEEG